MEMSGTRLLLGAGLLMLTCAAGACSKGSRKRPPWEGQAPSAPAQPSAAPTEPSPSMLEGEPLLALYDELSQTFAQHAGDCTKMRDEAALVMDRHKPAIQEWGAAMVMLNAAQADTAANRMREQSGARIDAFDAALKQAQSKCGAELAPLLDGVKPAGKPKP